jgi:hypothetical protein
MSGAEETVSPDVWKGVEAGLDRAARKRVVPMWLWRGLAAAAVAAAVTAVVVLPRHGENLSNQPTIQNPVASATTDDPLPALTQPEEEAVTPIVQQVARLKAHVAQAPETPVVDGELEELLKGFEEETTVVDIVPERKPSAIIGSSKPETVTSDEDAFKQLAFEEHKTRRRGQFSMSVLGNIQSNTRPESPASRIRRTSGMFMPRSPIETGISREGTEYSFGLPVSGGLSFRYDFNPRWGIGTGIVYTNLTRYFMGDYDEVVEKDGAKTFAKQLFDTDITNQQHYIGVPVNLFFNIVNTGNWNFHVRLDGMGEKLLDNHFLVHDTEGDIHLHQKASGLQFSAGVGVGLEFKFTPYLGIYFDPTLRYYFDCGQPRSLRTIQPLRMDFEAGLRLSLGQ